MASLTTKTRRELLGIFLGAIAGAGLGLVIPFPGFEPQSGFLVMVMATFGAIIVGFFFRGELGWIAYGTMVGAVIADLLWSNPKVCFAAAGIVPGAFTGLIAGIIRDLISRTPSPIGPPS